VIHSAMNIVGDPDVARKEDIVIVCGIRFKKGIQGKCHLQHLTLRQAKRTGVFGRSSFTMEDVLVEQCGVYGVYAYGTVVARCTNVEVRQCGGNGVVVEDDASIILIGAKTTVHHNCTKGSSDQYGLKVFGASTIQLVSPLTKEIVSVDNGGGGNWGANMVDGGDINQIKTIFERIPEAEVRVPEDCPSLKEAVGRVQEDDRLTTIVVGQGEHQIDDVYLYIPSAMNIVGDPDVARKDDIVIVGGIHFEQGIQGCHLQHLTLRKAEECGVQGYSSFTMEDVLVEQCDIHGVCVYDTVVAGCSNVEVRQCGGNGVCADMGASITLIGDKTTVHHNCTDGDSDTYGLKVYGSSSTIQLVSPLTKEIVSVDNGGGGN
jgi:hypothetical protein